MYTIGLYKILHTLLAYVVLMVLEGETKIYRSNGRHSIYIPADLIKDSAFPFTLKDRLKITITDGEIKLRKLERP
jgi:hypothetical protein